MRYAWPGNVRQLRNVTRRLVIANRGALEFTVDRSVQRLLDGAPSGGGAADIADAPAERRPAAELSDQEIVEALRRNGFSFSAATMDLGVSRSWLNTRVERCVGVRKAKDLTREEIDAAAERSGGNVATMAEQLEVSGRALVLQMTRLGLTQTVSSASKPPST